MAHKNEFKCVMDIAAQAKYKDKPLVKLLVSKIAFLKQSIIYRYALGDHKAGYIKGLNGEDGFSPFVFEGNMGSLKSEIDELVNFRLLTEYTYLLIEVLNEYGAKIEGI